MTPQTEAATCAAIPMCALLRTLTFPTETFTSPLWFELFWAAAAFPPGQSDLVRIVRLLLSGGL